MRIKRLARKAVFITAAVMVLVGFSTGIAGTASAAPTSAVSVSAVAFGGTTAVPHMPAGCTTGVCTLGLAGGPHPFEYVIQRWTCAIALHSGIVNPVFGVVNNCSTRVWTHAQPPHPVCISPHSTKTGVGRFGNVTNVQVTFATSNCPPGYP